MEFNQIAKKQNLQTRKRKYRYNFFKWDSTSKNHSHLEFLLVSHSGIFVKLETVTCKLDLSFKQRGCPEIGKMFSFVHCGPLWGPVLTGEQRSCILWLKEGLETGRWGF